MSRYIVFDVETTGLPKNRYSHPKNFHNWPYIVQISWIIVNDNKKIEKSFIIKPDKYTIPEDSIKIHNITNEIANKEGVLVKNVLEDFDKDCKEVDFILAHNSEFDKNVVLASFYRNNINTKNLKEKKTLCTMKSTTELCKLPGNYGYKYPRLEELYFFLFKKKPTGRLHNSLEDVRITLECYKELLNYKILT